MTPKSAATLPEVPGIDLSFRPQSYFWPLELETHLLSRIKGAERRAALQQMIDAGQVDDLPDFLTRSALSERERRAAGQMHPAFMGGEYLTDMRGNEVTIARITIASVTEDVTCVYARRGRNRIHYRVVDEYEGETLSGKNTRTSTRPLTLGELETFLNGAWPLFDVLEMNFAEVGYDLTSLLCFVVGVESEFYPQIGTLYERRIEAWSAERREALGIEEEEENENEDDEGDNDEGENDEGVAPPDVAAPRGEQA